MIQDGKFALVHYTGTLSDGEVFDSTDGREPFEFETGQGNVIPAFEEAVKSMAVDEEREISIKAADAYGDYKDDMIQKVPAAEVTEFLTPEVGLIIHVMTQDGQQIPARITGVTVHFVDEGVDSGPIVLQRPLPVPPDRDREALEEAVHATEHALLPEAVRLFAAGRISVRPGSRVVVIAPE